jgi:hypothetical protein
MRSCATSPRLRVRPRRGRITPVLISVETTRYPAILATYAVPDDGSGEGSSRWGRRPAGSMPVLPARYGRVTPGAIFRSRKCLVSKGRSVPLRKTPLAGFLASKRCQSSPARASRKCPDRSGKYLTDRIFLALSRAPMLFFPCASTLGTPLGHNCHHQSGTGLAHGVGTAEGRA